MQVTLVLYPKIVLKGGRSGRVGVGWGFRQPQHKHVSQVGRRDTPYDPVSAATPPGSIVMEYSSDFLLPLDLSSSANLGAGARWGTKQGVNGEMGSEGSR